MFQILFLFLFLYTKLSRVTKKKTHLLTLTSKLTPSFPKADLKRVHLGVNT